jgi:hypothetical protein
MTTKKENPIMALSPKTSKSLTSTMALKPEDLYKLGIYHSQSLQPSGCEKAPSIITLYI